MSVSAAARLIVPPALFPERDQDAPLVEGLIERAFGPGRLAKTAERLREFSLPILDLSFVAWSEGEAVGCVRLWPITIGEGAIGETPALLLGPFAVEEAWRKRGLGAALILRACDEARRRGHGLIVLVGDEPFFGPLGFSARDARGIRLPGPVDPRRVLARALRAGAADDVRGLVRPIRA